MDRIAAETDRLPPGFVPPAAYLDALARPELPDLDPWFWLAEDDKLARFWSATLARLYPERRLHPFAKDGGSDDIACFDAADGSGRPRVYLVHAFASPGWEYRGEYTSFERWLETILAEVRRERESHDG